MRFATVANEACKVMQERAYTGMGLPHGMQVPVSTRVTLSDMASGLPLARWALDADYTDLENRLLQSGVGKSDLPARLRGPTDHPGPMVKFSPDGRLLFGQNKGSFTVHELATGKPLWLFRSPEPLRTLFTLEPRTLGIITTPSGTMTLYDFFTGKRRDWTTGVLSARMAISPDRRRMATAHEDTT